MTIAEHVGELEPKALQRFLNLSPWDADALLDLNREYAMEHLADPGGILVADPTGSLKRARKSVGVQRQYSGTLGGLTTVRSRLSGLCHADAGSGVAGPSAVPAEKSWMADPARCAEAGVPRR